jgi:hypothetical protein
MVDHKDDISFYKEIYNRERDRRFILDNAISQPITVCSILVALLYFLYKSTNLLESSFLNYAIIGLLILAFTGFIICLFFLASSYNNLVAGFSYQELPSTIAMRQHQEELDTYNSQQNEADQKSFNEYLLRNYVKCADSYITINDTRSLHLHYAKKAMIIALGVTILGIILFIINTAVMSNDNNQTPATGPASTSNEAASQPAPQPIQSVPIPMPIEPQNRMVKADDSIPLARPGTPTDPTANKEQK